MSDRRDELEAMTAEAAADDAYRTVNGFVNRDDDLRDRLAKALWVRFGPQIELSVDGTWEEQHPVAREMWREDADEIILALGLKHYCRDCGGYGPFDD